MSERILLIEDEPKLARLVADYLHASGYQVNICERGDAALSAIEQQRPQLLLLDLMLPGLDGIEVCRRLRAMADPELASMPVLMITARIDEVDRILGLEVGADDYICKPFSPREIVARVRAHLRRLQWSHSHSDGVDASGLQLDREAMRAQFDGVPVNLTPVEFRLLGCLLERPGRVYSRDQLTRAAYTDHRVVSDRTIDTHVKNLRRKLGAAMQREAPISSVYGVGYRYEP